LLTNTTVEAGTSAAVESQVAMYLKLVSLKNSFFELGSRNKVSGSYK